MFEFPEVPEDLDALSASALRALARDIRQVCHAIATDLAGAAEALGMEEDEALAQAEAHAKIRQTVLTKMRVKMLSDSTSDAGDDDEPDSEDEDEDDADGEADVEASTDPEPHIDPPVTEDAEHSASPARIRTSTSVGARPDATASRRVHATQLVQARSNDRFESWEDFATALIDKARMVDGTSREKFTVGRSVARFDEVGTKLTEDMLFNLQLFERAASEELTAAMCAPAIPLYDLACANTDRRPVFNSLAAFQPAQRGAVTVYPSPTLEDITTGYGQWTNTEDENPAAEKEPCQTIECATPVEYRLYGVYRCLTVKNLLQLTYPELVEAYLNRLAAAWARMAEVLLLNAMGTSANATDVTGTGWGGTVSLIHGFLQYLTKYQELQRWDNPEMEFWAHRGVLNAIKADIIARTRYDGGVTRVPSDAQVNAMFTDVGFTPHWTLDVANWMTALQPFEGGGGQLGHFPRSADFLVAPRGKFGVMDRGNLSVGVTGNNIYRDNTSNSRNEFTFFFESFEGVVDTDSCPAHILNFDDLCWNGRQVNNIYVGCLGEADADASGAL